jgi:hypothetical protein
MPFVIMFVIFVVLVILIVGTTLDDDYDGHA